MNISVFGLGYVGTVTAGCFAELRHRVVGVDVAEDKVELLNSGRSPVIEDRIEDIIRDAVAQGNLRATGDIRQAVASSDLCLVCVGTPSLPNGSLDQTHVCRVMEQIGACIPGREEPLLVVIRSTVLPGTVRDVLIPILQQACGRPVGNGYDVVFHPEFLREGSSVADFYDPPKIVVGERVPGAAEQLLAIYRDRIQAPTIVCSIEEAEMVKYCDNAFHALKATFANEISQLCRALQIDAARVMEIFCQDRKLNISDKYLRPGFAFGGSCLPKDLRALLAAAKRLDLELPVLESILPSNTKLVERMLRFILQTGAATIGLYGLAFKPGTDDLRESPYVELAERLLGKGKRIVCFDERVCVARLVGRNKSYVEQKLPHLSELLADTIAPLATCDVVLACHPANPSLVSEWTRAGVNVLHLSEEVMRPEAGSEDR
jgi:GDP-mannose 6-dehydrogenase